MGFRDLVLFYVVTGISLRWIATAATAGPSAIVIWLVAWAGFFVPLALSVLELSSRFPEEGGLYNWSKLAFGDFTGFMAGWTYWASNLPYYPGVLYFTAANALYIGGARWSRLADSRLYFVLFAVLGLLLATLLNIVGLGIGKWLHNIGAIGTWVPIAVLIGMGGVVWYKFGSANHFSAPNLIPSTHLKDIIFWSTIVFALGGCESASFMGGEIKNPRRNVPRALLIGSILITVGYILGTTAVLWALPKSQVTGLDGIMQAISQISNRLGISWIIGLVALLITLSNLGAVGAWLTATARLPFVAGLDRYLPKPFAKLHPKWKTPYVALLVEAVCGVIFAFLGQAGTSVKGAYDVLVSMGVITYFLPYLALFASMIKLQRFPCGPEVIRVPGGKPAAYLLATTGIITTTLTIILSCFPEPDDANKALAVLKVLGLTAVLLAVGVFLYATGKKAARGEFRRS
ncbi:MAG TPA: APC family permease [Terriglobia bacterium]|nr:APC family permease [Terriglobia bacterium]